MRNKTKFWRRIGAAIKRALFNNGQHTAGHRYGRTARVVPQPPQWRGGPVPMVAPSPLLSGLLKRQASL